MSTNSDLHQRRQAAVPRGVTNSLAIYADRGANAELWDIEGRRFIDFASGISVLNTGHLHPKVKAALAGQLDRFTHACFQVTPYGSSLAFPAELNPGEPGTLAKQSGLLFTGAAADDNAIKIARFHTRRS